MILGYQMMGFRHALGERGTQYDYLLLSLSGVEIKTEHSVHTPHQQLNMNLSQYFAMGRVLAFSFRQESLYTNN